MTIGKISKKEYTNKKFKTKLRVEDYVFEIQGCDIFGVDLTYSFDYIESTIYKNGSKIDIIREDVLTLELSGKDKDDNEAWVCFDMKFDINYLKSLSEVPTDISNLFIYGESFIKRPLEEMSGFLDFELPKNKVDDIYRNLSSLWISKIGENEFIIKLCIPNEVFTYFKLILKNH